MTDDRRLQRAILLFEQSNFPGAEAELRQFLLEDPEHPVAHALLGLCLSHRKSYDEASEEARLAIHYGPDIGITHYANASILEDRNRIDEGLQAIRAAVEIDPGNASFIGLQAALLMKKRRWSDALETANRGLESDPEDPTCGNVRAAALVQLGRSEEANQTIDGMLARAPTDAHAHANQGWSSLHQRDYPKASEHFREALRLEPNLEWARAGMMETLKARNPLYRLLLRFFLAMSKLSRQGQWAVILGLFIGFRVVRNLANNNPEWAPYVQPLLFIYIAFAALTWIGGPLFNLLLRLDRFGRYVLSEDERKETNIFGLVLLLAVVFGGLGVFYGGLWIWAALLAALLLLPICATFRCEKGWPRNAMAAYTAILGAVGIASAFVPAAFILFLLGCFLSSLVGNILAMQMPKK